jgi:MoxR-like ATPase
MSRTRIPYPSAQPVYEAARRWRDRSLIDDLSLFGDGRVATVENAALLVRDFVDQPDVGRDSFLTKLRGQLSASPPEAVRLAAELLYVHLLVARSTTIGEQKKTELVRTVLGFAEGGHDIPADLAKALGSGLINPGQGYNNYRWRQFAYLIKVVVALKQLPIPRRRLVMTDPGAFVVLLDEIEENGAAIQRYSLEHLLFPDVFAPVVSRGHRQRIIATWDHLAGAPSERPSIRLGTVANGLPPNATWGSEEYVNFYRAPYVWEWSDRNDRWTAFVRWGQRLWAAVEPTAEERSAKLERVKELRNAREATTRGRPALVAEMYTALRYFVARPVARPFLTWLEGAEDAADVLSQLWTDAGPTSVDRFLARLPDSAAAGTDTRLHLAAALLGAVDATALPLWRARVVDDAYRLTRHNKPEPLATEGERYAWFLEFLDQVIDAFRRDGTELADRHEAQLLVELLTEDDPPEEWSAVEVDGFRAWRSGSGAQPPDVVQEAATATELAEPERSLTDVAADLYLDEPFLERIIELLEEKKQVIFQGTPGTGKTHVARELANWFAKSRNRVWLVQFHPTYSYEDFVEGFRPREDGNGFALVDGPLREMAKKARANPDNRYVLIIDELNRGNVARVFGELYFLLEYRDELVRLLYRRERFKLPPNLFLIATMNTADRSIALLDSALSRRFRFVDFEPDKGSIAAVLRRYLRTRHPEHEWVADVVAVANRRIADPDAAIGPSHFFRGKDKKIDDAWLELVWEHTVLPTLKDHFHGRADRLAELDLARLREEVTAPGDDAPTS